MATGDGRNVENLLHATKELTDNYVGNINDLEVDRNTQVTLETPVGGGVAVSTPKVNASKDFILNESYLYPEKSNFNDTRSELLIAESNDSEEDEGLPESPNGTGSSGIATGSTQITTHATIELSEHGKKQPQADDTSKLLNVERSGNNTSKLPASPNSSTHLIQNESNDVPKDGYTKPGNQSSDSYSIDIDDDGDKDAEELESDGSDAESGMEDNASDNLSISSVRTMPDPDIDKHLPDTVTLLMTPEGAKVYLVGTAHFSTESQEDVAMIIRAVQPHVVLVELCQARVNILQLDEKTILEEAKNINLEKIQSMIKQNGLFHGVMYMLLLSMSAHLTKQLGMAPGGEFRRAFAEAKRVPSCLVHLGDRPIQITLKRALASLSWWQTLRLTWHLLTCKDPISKEEVERCKRRDLLEEMLAEMAGEFPALGTVFVNERDVFLSHSLHLAATPVANSPRGPVPAKVVGVVGIGHVPGIVQNWGKVSPADIPPIMQLPPPSISGRVLKFTVKASCVCVVVWGISKLLPQSGLSTIKSSVQGFFSA